MLNFWWFNVSPIKLGLAPFDTSAIHIDTSAALFKQRMNHWALGPLGDYQFIASPIQIHLFIVTCFVAMIAPFGSIFFSALKRALKTDHGTLHVYLHEFYRVQASRQCQEHSRYDSATFATEPTRALRTTFRVKEYLNLR